MLSPLSTSDLLLFLTHHDYLIRTDKFNPYIVNLKY